jgi:hypothetical protein
MPPHLQTSKGLQAAINSEIETKKAKLTTPFTKYLAISNPANGIGFLDKV